MQEAFFSHLQKAFFDQLLPSLSIERLRPYQISPREDVLDVYAKYLWNISVSESLYPTLNTLEVALRNNIYEAVCVNFHSKWLDNCDQAILRPSEIAKIEDAKRRLVRAHKRPYGGQLVAELNLGFWTSFFNARYDVHLCRRLLSDQRSTRIFPRLPRSMRTRRTLSAYLYRIRTLRNRVFHHEPIWYDRELSQKHAEILDVIYWINPTLRESLVTIDRFPQVLARGVGYYRTRLEEFLRSSRSL